MCGGSAPAVVRSDPVADAERAAAEAAVAANSQAANRRRSRRRSSLLTTQPKLGGVESSVFNYGSTVLGG